MHLDQTTAHDAPLLTDARGMRDNAHRAMPLDDALHLLQVDPGHSLADPGLARLTASCLDRLFLAARHQAERNHDGILLLLDLLQLAQGAERVSARA